MKFRIPALILCFAPALWGQSYTIATVAGGSLPPFPAIALSTSIGEPLTVTVDSAGNVYFADGVLNVIFKTDTSGLMTLVAGTGHPGYSGDGVPATSAQLRFPYGTAIDAAGNLYISDSGNERVRKVSPSGIITTLAGNGTFGYSGDGGPATQASLSDPSGIAFDGKGNVYIADASNSVIRRVAPDGIITTFAGNGTVGYSGDGGPATLASLSFPFGVAVDATGNVYIADNQNNVIRKVDAAGTITTFAGTGTSGYSGDGGPAINAQISYPAGVATDAAGNVFIADNPNERVRKVSTAGVITTVAGNGSYGYSGDGGPALNATFKSPQGVATGPNGILYVADSDNRRIRKVSSAQEITSVAGNGFDNYAGDNGPAINALLAQPDGVAVSSNGMVYIGDSLNDRVRAVSANGTITTIAGNGNQGYSGNNGPATAAELNIPQGVALDSAGNILIVDELNEVIRKVAPDEVITTLAANGNIGATPTGIAIDSLQNVYVTDPYVSNEVYKISTDGIVSRVVGNGSFGYSGDNGPAIDATLGYPKGIVFDANGNLLIADTQNHVIREVNTGGIITTIAGNGTAGNSGDGGLATSAQLNGPYGVAVDETGDIFIADSYNSNIRMVSSSGNITTIAGASPGYYGDGGPALEAGLETPDQIALGPNGILYFTDSANNAVRTLTPCIQFLTSTSAADSTAHTLSIPITAAASCTWSASNLPPWIISASSGTGTGTLSVSLNANTTGTDLTATIKVNGLPLTVTQKFTAQAFQDVPPSISDFDAINLIKAKAITSGCTPTDYCPLQSATRAQMAVFIVRAILGEGTFTYSPTPYFTDVQPADYAFAYIQKFFELGITTGCAPGLYCPNDSTTRAQTAVFVIRARYGSQTDFDYTNTQYFTDVAPGAFAYNYIQRMKEDNITSGCTATTYCPDNPVTRGDIAVFIMRGAFNQLLPSTEPIIASVAPKEASIGIPTTLTVIGQNTNFMAGSTTVKSVPGLNVDNGSLVVVSPTMLTVSVTANTSVIGQPLSIWVTDPAGEAVLPNGLTTQ